MDLMQFPAYVEFLKMTRGERETAPEIECGRCGGTAHLRASLAADGSLAVLIACVSPGCLIVHLDGVDQWPQWKQLDVPTPKELKRSEEEERRIHRRLRQLRRGIRPKQ